MECAACVVLSGEAHSASILFRCAQHSVQRHVCSGNPGKPALRWSGGATAGLGGGVLVQVLLYLMQAQVWGFFSQGQKAKACALVPSTSSLCEQS